MPNQETIKCPKCNSEEVWDLDCESCNGNTEVQDLEGNWVMCEDCQGEGMQQGYLECGDCHHIWEI